MSSGVRPAGRAGPDGAAALEEEAAVGDAGELLQRLVDDEDGEARPCSAWIAAQISWRTTGARPSVASSRIRSRGFVISARPIASICCSPPERVLARLRAALGEAGEERLDAGLRPAAGAGGGGEVLLDGQGREAAAALGDEADAEAGDAVDGEAAGRLAGEGDRALARAEQREMVRTVVVLPMPLRPISATTSPSAMSRSTPKSAWLAP